MSTVIVYFLLMIFVTAMASQFLPIYFWLARWLAWKPGDENPFAESYLFINLLTMASAKGFDRQETPRTLEFWLVYKSRESNYFTRNDFWEFSSTHQKTIDFREMKRQTFFNKKFIIVSLHSIMRKGCVGVTWLSRPSDIRRVRARSWLDFHLPLIDVILLT